MNAAGRQLTKFPCWETWVCRSWVPPSSFSIYTPEADQTMQRRPSLTSSQSSLGWGRLVACSLGALWGRLGGVGIYLTPSFGEVPVPSNVFGVP